MPNLLIYLALLVIVVLAGIACFLHIKLYRQAQAKRRQHDQHVQVQNRAQKSIEILCRAVVADQVLLAEASIRIAVLLKALDLQENEMSRYSAFTNLANATAHIPILDDWRKLSRKQQQQFDSERENIEAKYHDFVMDAAQAYLARHH